MKELFVPYEIALEFKKLGFDKYCFGVFYTMDGKNWQLTDISHLEILDEMYDFGKDAILKSPTYQQVIDWFQEKYDIYIGKTGYNDKITPKRWVYHVDDYYVQDQSLDGAIKYAIELIKNKK